ncbi:MAG: hypothetical protein KF824_08375 [Fimbriimonadaceae bacterium]|nr:MAG: hypothetical protein KF824_08375 [Fimbriimonadaceae bacterium]
MFSFKCPKCDGKKYSLSELRGAEGGIGAFFNLDNAIFTVVTCEKCGFSELFKCGLKMFKHRFAID